MYALSVQRLQSRAQFQAVLAGATVAKTAHFAIHSNSREPSCTTDSFWLGAVVPKRWAKRAVTRNLIKRLIYSVAGRYETTLPAGAYVVRLRAGFDRKLFPSAKSKQLHSAVRAEVEHLFNEVLTISPKVY